MPGNSVKIKQKVKSTTLFNQVLLFLLTTIISSIVFDDVSKYFKHKSLYQVQNFCASINDVNSLIDPKMNISPTFTIFNKSPQEYHLKHVIEILSRMGLQRVDIDDDWDVLWAHDFPFRVLSTKIKNLKSHQKVNHFPGCGFLTNKVDLSTTTSLKFLPRAFKLPKDKLKLIQYNDENPQKLFVEKHNEHRHIYIKSLNQINLNSNDSFVQEYIDDPYLVDGYKFDVGVYVIITSINPLRVYIYTGDVLFRYCSEKYYPFNSSNINKYVVGDDYLPTWEMPSLKVFYNQFKLGMKDSFNAYVRKHGQEPAIIWTQVETIIRETILSKESDIIQILKPYKNENFFELMRFDLIIKKDLTVYLMEANMSPNLSSAHFKANSLLYEQILYSVMQLVGIGSPMKRENLKRRSEEYESVISSEKNIATFFEECFNEKCQEFCNGVKCEMCLPCLSEADEKILHNAYREHIHKTDTKRIFPVPIKNLETFNLDNEIRNLSARNIFMSKWFFGKCKMEISWCT